MADEAQGAAAMGQPRHHASGLPFQYMVAAWVGPGAWVATPADTRWWLQPLAPTPPP